MFEKLKYQRKARDYFRPHESIEVGREDFLKILRGEVVNPNRLSRPKDFVDYSYFIVGVTKNSPLNCWARQKTEPNTFWNAEQSAVWYGRFFCERDSTLIVPYMKSFVSFNPHSKNLLGKIFSGSFVQPLYLTGGVFQEDKIGDRILVSDLSVSDLQKCLKEVYGEGFSVGK
jgi:hypothetical protein